MKILINICLVKMVISLVFVKIKPIYLKWRKTKRQRINKALLSINKDHKIKVVQLKIKI